MVSISNEGRIKFGSVTGEENNASEISLDSDDLTTILDIMPKGIKQAVTDYRYTPNAWDNVDNVTKLIPSFAEAFRATARNLHWTLSDHNCCGVYQCTDYVDFLCDSLDYMSTGRRRVDLSTWRLLLESHCDNRPSLTRAEAHANFLKLKRKVEEIIPDFKNQGVVGKYINQWLIHKGGVRELAYTLMILHRPTRFNLYM